MFDQLITHKNCPDGVACTWVVRQICPDIQVIAISHKEPFPLNELSGRVLFTDCAPPRDMIDDVLMRTEHVTVIDHHEIEWLLEYVKDHHDKLNVVWHKLLSGCQLTWDYFHFEEPRPWFIDYIGDRDTWQFNLPDSRLINQGMYDANRLWIKTSSPTSARQASGGNSDAVLVAPNKPVGIELLAYETTTTDIEILKEKYRFVGEVNSSKSHGLVEGYARNAILAVFNHRVYLDSDRKDYEVKKYRVKLVTGCSYLFSEIGERINDDSSIDFAIHWTHDPKEKIWSFSLRGRDKVDLAALSRTYGMTQPDASTSTNDQKSSNESTVVTPNSHESRDQTAQSDPEQKNPVEDKRRVKIGGGHVNAAGFSVCEIDPDLRYRLSFDDLISFDDDLLTGSSN
jgi:hypothetical protein